MAETPGGDGAVPKLLGYCAAACITVAAQALYAGKPLLEWGRYAGGGIAFAVAAAIWPRIRMSFGGGILVDLLERIAEFRRYLIIAALACIAFTRPEPIYRYSAIGIAVLVVLWIAIAWRRDIDRYVMPRRVTPRQARRLLQYLATAPKFSIRVSVDPLDSEAREYAGALYGLLQRGGWTVQFDTAPPYNQNEGLGIHATGVSTPVATSSDPRPVLQNAARFAGIDINHGGGVGAGNFQVSLTVGKRPLAINAKAPLLQRLGRFLLRFGHSR
jgi:hypothetical protein